MHLRRTRVRFTRVFPSVREAFINHYTVTRSGQFAILLDRFTSAGEDRWKFEGLTRKKDRGLIDRPPKVFYRTINGFDGETPPRALEKRSQTVEGWHSVSEGRIPEALFSKSLCFANLTLFRDNLCLQAKVTLGTVLYPRTQSPAMRVRARPRACVCSSRQTQRVGQTYIDQRLSVKGPLERSTLFSTPNPTSP